MKTEFSREEIKAFNEKGFTSVAARVARDAEKILIETEALLTKNIQRVVELERRVKDAAAAAVEDFREKAIESYYESDEDVDEQLRNIPNPFK